jgi:hypothetical protein
MDHRDLFKAHYVAHWAAHVPFTSGQQSLWDWYDLLDGTPLPNGAVLMEIYPLRDAQVEELYRVWAQPSP